MLNEAIDLQSRQKLYGEMNAYYKGFQEYYISTINSMLLQFNFELVFYDETEFFREFDDPEFMYPYMPRKQTVAEYKFTINKNRYADYQFNSPSVKFQRSESCLEGNVFLQMDFLSKLVSEVNGLIQAAMGTQQEEEPADDNNGCDGPFFRKIKYVKSKDQIKTFTDWFPAEQLRQNNYNVLIELEISQDSTKAINSRSSTQILDFLGDIGGFQQALYLLLFTFGEYFSARFFIQEIASKLYVKKKTKADLSTKEHDLYEGGSQKKYVEDENSLENNLNKNDKNAT